MGLGIVCFSKIYQYIDRMRDSTRVRRQEGSWKPWYIDIDTVSMQTLYERVAHQNYPRYSTYQGGRFRDLDQIPYAFLHKTRNSKIVIEFEGVLSLDGTAPVIPGGYYLRVCADFINQYCPEIGYLFSDEVFSLSSSRIKLVFLGKAMFDNMGRAKEQLELFQQISNGGVFQQDPRIYQTPLADG